MTEVGLASRSSPWVRAGGKILDEITAPVVLPLLRERRGRLALLFLLGVLGAGMALVPPWLTKLVIDEGLLASNVSALIQWSLALFLFGLLSLGFGALSSILHMRASVTMLADLRAHLISAALGHSPAWRAKHQTGELMARIDGDAAAVQQFAFNALLTGSGAIVRLIGGAVLLFLLNWKLAIIACCLAPIELIFLWRVRPKTEALAHASRAARGRFSGQLGEVMAGLSSLQTIRGEPAVKKRMDAAQRTLNARLMAAHLWGEFTRAVPQILSALVRGAVFVMGGLAVIRGDWPLGSLIAFLAYLSFLTGPTQSLLGLWHAQASLRAALVRIGWLLNDKDSVVSWPVQAASLPADNNGCEVMFRGVALANTFSAFDGNIPSGACCRLEGASGVGKSRLLALLHRHSDPDDGNILLDGIDLRALSKNDIRQAVTIVAQRPFLIHASLGENLRLAHAEYSAAVTDEQLWELLRLVELDARFTQKGLEAVLGEDGLSVSGGERQRLCLARALVNPGRVLVLDEALSEVDGPTTQRIMTRIHTRWPTTTRIITTHEGASLHGPFDLQLSMND